MRKKVSQSISIQCGCNTVKISRVKNHRAVSFRFFHDVSNSSFMTDHELSQTKIKTEECGTVSALLQTNKTVINLTAQILMLRPKS